MVLLTLYMYASRNVFREFLWITCGWAIDVSEIMLSLIEGSNGPLSDYAKKPIDTFTGKIEQGGEYVYYSQGARLIFTK